MDLDVKLFLIQIYCCKINRTSDNTLHSVNVYRIEKCLQCKTACPLIPKSESSAMAISKSAICHNCKPVPSLPQPQNISSYTHLSVILTFLWFASGRFQGGFLTKHP
jgi:flavoprotein